MTHTHTADCIYEDILDLGDDGDGYVAYPFYVCKITGEEHKTFNEFFEEK
jgi:hypothetical protein